MTNIEENLFKAFAEGKKLWHVSASIDIDITCLAKSGEEVKEYLNNYSRDIVNDFEYDIQTNVEHALISEIPTDKKSHYFLDNNLIYGHEAPDVTSTEAYELYLKWRHTNPTKKELESLGQENWLDKL